MGAASARGCFYVSRERRPIRPVQGFAAGCPSGLATCPRYGFDVGGTKIHFAAFGPGLRPLADPPEERFATPADPAAFLEAIASRVEAADAQLGTRGAVGLALPGRLDPEGIVVAVNVPGAHGRPVRAELGRRLGREVFCGNDANCFALAEAAQPELRGKRCVLAIALGTGLGAGVVVDGRVLEGKNGFAGEVGHGPLPVNAWRRLGEPTSQRCGCGQDDCVELFLSRAAFERRWEESQAGPENGNPRPRRRQSSEIIDLGKSGDADAQEFERRYIGALACCLQSWIASLDPDAVVFGGNIAEHLDALFTEGGLRAELAALVLPGAEPPTIVRAALGVAGGVRGAALLPGALA